MIIWFRLLFLYTYFIILVLFFVNNHLFWQPCISGYNIEANKDNIVSWGHITCGGTVANIEAMWAARNLKFHPLAVKKALAVSFFKANINYKL